MPINTGVPATTRKPGSFQVFDVISGQRGLVPAARRIALIGARKTGAGTGVNGVQAQIFSEADAETLWGKGSELALMARAAFKAAAKYLARWGGGMPEIWGVSVAEGATKGTWTVTITGPATESGDLVIRIAGRTIAAGVTSGDSAATCATKLVSAIAAKYSDLPVTAAVGGVGSEHIVTLTAVCGGVNGADIDVTVEKKPAGTTAVAAAGVAAAGAYDITAALDALVDQHYNGIAIANHAAADIGDLKAHIDARGAAGAKAWVMTYLAETGTLATHTGLCTTANYKEIVVIGCEDSPSLPGEIAAQVCASAWSEQDPALSFDGVELDLYLPPKTSVYTDPEIETILAAGGTPLVPNANNTAAKIVRLVTTKTTEGGAPFENCLDHSNVRSLFYVAGQVDARWSVAFQRAKQTARTLKDIYSVTYRVLKDCEALEILKNVDAHAAELFVEVDAQVPTRVNVAIPQAVVPNLHQLVGKHTLFVE